MNSTHCFVALILGATLTGVALADNPVPSQHALVKECMAKQKEADSGKPKDDLRAFCKDWAKTQRDADKQQAPSKG